MKFVPKYQNRTLLILIGHGHAEDVAPIVDRVLQKAILVVVHFEIRDEIVTDLHRTRHGVVLLFAQIGQDFADHWNVSDSLGGVTIVDLWERYYQPLFFVLQFFVEIKLHLRSKIQK
jgi:hypothetical protein